MPADALGELVDDGRAWVVAVDGEVAGFLAVRVVDGAAHVEEVAVDPRFGRRGYATSLLGEVTSWARESALPAITLTTFRDVPWNRPFYEQRGYRVVEPGELSEALRELVRDEEERHGLPAELRVVMRKDVAPDVTVRDATLDDLGAITGLFNALIPTTTIAWRDHLADAEEMRSWWDTQQAQDNPVLVAAVGDDVVGYVTWSWFRGGPRFPGYRHTRELTIHVDGGHHGRGVGRMLIDALVDRARAAGVHVLVAGVDAANEASIEFHRRLGFEAVAAMPEVGRKFDRWLDLVLMQRTLA
jgi:phosphinothricin acetyltransferase